MINRIPGEVLDEGLSYRSYRETVRRNGAVLDEAYDAPAYAEEDLLTLRRLPELKIVALVEDWCPDVVHTLPTWAHLADLLPGWSCHLFPRDQHPELMGSFLYRSRAQRIPVYAFYDQRNYLQTWWSGRSREAEAWVRDFLAGREYDDLDEAARAELAEAFDRAYRERFRRANFAETMSLLRAFFHVE